MDSIMGMFGGTAAGAGDAASSGMAAQRAGEIGNSGFASSMSPDATMTSASSSTQPNWWQIAGQQGIDAAKQRLLYGQPPQLLPGPQLLQPGGAPAGMPMGGMMGQPLGGGGDTWAPMLQSMILGAQRRIRATNPYGGLQ